MIVHSFWFMSRFWQLITWGDNNEFYEQVSRKEQARRIVNFNLIGHLGAGITSGLVNVLRNCFTYHRSTPWDYSLIRLTNSLLWWIFFYGMSNPLTTAAQFMAIESKSGKCAWEVNCADYQLINHTHRQHFSKLLNQHSCEWYNLLHTRVQLYTIIKSRCNVTVL